MRRLILIFAVLALSMQAFAYGDQPQGASETATAIKPGPDDPKQKVEPGPIDEDAPREFTETKSGLKYRILRKSDQAKPTETDIVEVHYKGWLDDGTIFGSSYRSGDKISFPVRRVIQGWTEGMQLIGIGGMIELEVPPELGFGERGKKGEVPPGARLHFIIELFSTRQEVKLL